MAQTRWARGLLLLAVPLLLALGLAGCGGDGSSTALPGTAAQQAALTTAVHTAAQGLAAVAVHPDGTCDLDAVKAYVHAVRFLDDQSGYFFVYDDTNNFCLAHAILTAWEGTDKSDYQDSRGLYPVQEFSKMAKATGRGFLVFYFNNPTTGTEQQKLGYMEVIPGTTIYIGSGIYVGG